MSSGKNKLSASDISNMFINYIAANLRRKESYFSSVRAETEDQTERDWEGGLKVPRIVTDETSRRVRGFGDPRRPKK